MEFKIEKRERQTELQFPEKEFNIAREFAKRAYQEFGTFVKALVLFGSTVKGKMAKEGDIDILIIIDEKLRNIAHAYYEFSESQAEYYNIINYF